MYLFIYSHIYLMILLVSHTIQHQINDTTYSVKQSWPVLMCYPYICLKALKKTINNLKDG